jgi:hypothetical protein
MATRAAVEIDELSPFLLWLGQLGHCDGGLGPDEHERQQGQMDSQKL